jgi:WxL domain surface cell wall-binding
MATDRPCMRNSIEHPNVPARRLRNGIAAAACALAACVLPASALGANDTTQFSVNAGSLAFGSAPNVPNFSPITLNGQAQNTTGQMSNFTVDDASGSGAGWNVTVAGDTAGSKSPVFKQYCDNGVNPCGSDAANSYVSGGATLPANSLTLNSTGAGFTAQGGSSGTAPTHQCDSGCFVDAASAVKTASAAVGAGMGTYQANSYSATSLSLATPSNLAALPANEVYRVDLLWSLNSGP